MQSQSWCDIFHRIWRRSSLRECPVAALRCIRYPKPGSVTCLWDCDMHIYITIFHDLWMYLTISAAFAIYKQGIMIYLSIKRQIYLSCLWSCSDAQRRWTVQRPQQRDADVHLLEHTSCFSLLDLHSLSCLLRQSSVCTCHTYTVPLHWRPCSIRLFLARF